MKRLFLLLVLCGSFSLSHIDAQCQSAAKNNDLASVAAKKAAFDAGIVQKVSQVSGEVSYYRKSVCPTTGRVSLTEVQYCSKSGRFVSYVPPGKETCLKSKADCSKSAGAIGSSSTGSRTGDASPAQRAACSSAVAKSTAAKKAKA